MSETTEQEEAQTVSGSRHDRMVKLRAWVVFSGHPMDGCLLVFANTRNAARKAGFSKGPWEWADYIDVSARRAPEHDKYATGEHPYVIVTNEELPAGAVPFYANGAI